MNRKEEYKLNEQLIKAAKDNNLEGITKALDKGANINYQEDFYRQTALHKNILSFFKDPRVVELLIKRGANVNIQDTDGNTPLHLTTYYDDLYNYNDETEIVRLLLEAKADINIKNEGNDTFLDSAERSGRSKIVRIIEQHMKKETAVKD